jgi:UDP-glucuronate 4-epimerase
VTVAHLIEVIEGATGRKAARVTMPNQPGDLLETTADLTAINADFGYTPKTSIEIGVPAFVDWYRSGYEELPLAPGKRSARSRRTDSVS